MNSAPHELAPLLVALGLAGTELAAYTTDPARLWFKCPDGRAGPSPDLLERLRLHRAAILGLLAGGYVPDAHPTGDDAGYAYGERFGVADGLGMPTHFGSPAWLVAVGAPIRINRCHSATSAVYSEYGSTDKGHRCSREVERPNPLCDSQGRESRSESTVSAAERRTRIEHGHD